MAAGMAGLLDALRKSSSRDEKFENYARIRIHGSIYDELRAQDWVSRRLRKSISQAVTGGDSDGIVVVPTDDLSGLVAPTHEVQSGIDRRTLDEALKTLPNREANLIAWHYFDGVMFKDVAKRLGLSAPRIVQLHARALRRLREALEPQDAIPR
jgi:RNA polymerase sigma factor for flagellar operon FliA